MSIRSQLQNKAVAMAEAMAERARDPQALEAIRQRIVAQVQSGELPPYVGVPLVQDLTQKLTQAQQRMAQMVMGIDTPPTQGGAPVAQQVMEQAQQGAGVEALPSNLPQSYAPGGLVAFADGGEVERYSPGGATTPVGRWWEGVRQSGAEHQEAERIRNELQAKYGPASALPGLFMQQTDEERAAAKAIAGMLPKLSLPQLKMLQEQGPAAIPSLTATLAQPPAGTTPTAVPATPPAAPTAAPAPAPAAATSTPMPALPGVRMPSVNLATYTPGVLGPATDFTSPVKESQEKARSAFETARDAEEKYQRALSEPGEKSREERFKLREAALEKDSAMGRALNLMSLGFGIAGSKERTLAGALGNEGRQGIQALIQGEAANRVAKERLEDARDNFEQQKVAARKGDRAAALAAGQRAADDIRAYTQLNMQAASYGSQEAMQRYQAGEQAKQFQVGEANKAALGLAGLDLQRQDIAQRGALGAQQIQLGQQRLKVLQDQVAAGNQRAAAALAGAQQKAYAAFQTSPAFRQAQEQAKKMPPVEAQRFMQQEWLKYRANALPALIAAQEGDASIPTFNDLYKATAENTP